MEHKTLLEYFQEHTSSHPFEVLHHITLKSVSPGHVELDFHSEEQLHSNPRGDVYGGVHLSLSDYLMGLACFTLGKEVTTAQINGNFVKSLPKNARIRGVSNVEHKGQSTMVTSCRLYNDMGELVYMGSGTFMVLDDLALPELPWSLLDEE